jgi:hypothetical protein
MIPALPLLLALVAQVPTSVRPVGASPEFNGTLASIEAATKSSDFAKAALLLGRLPKETITYRWDDSKVPASLRAEFAQQRDEAFQDWKGYLSQLKISEGPKPDVVFSFEPELAQNPESGMPFGLATFLSDDPAKPRLEAVIGLRRGKQKKPTTAGEVGNEVRFVVAKMLGLGPGPFFGPASSRTDLSTHARTLVTQQESHNASQIRNFVLYLRQAIEKKQPIDLPHPVAYTDIKELQLGTVGQGQIISVSVPVTNNGDGPLSFSIHPDCGCIQTTPGGTIDPGTTKLLRADFDTSQFTGAIHKRLMIYTNDPDRAAFVIPLSAQVRPAYRFIRPEGDVVVASGRQAQATVYLVLPEGSDIHPTGYRLDGMRAKVRAEEWSGSLADPEANEGAMPRKGYKITMDFDDAMPMGRAGLTLTVDTDSEAFPNVLYNLFIQKGIVALPGRLYLGQVGGAPKEARFVLSRPKQAFKIIGVTSSSPNLKPAFERDEESGDYIVTVNYDGKAPKGLLSGKLVVKTDDPSQPSLEVPVTGTVK